MDREHRVEKQQAGKLPAEHRGMPPRDPQPQPSLVGNPITQKDVSAETSLRLPHERDQSMAMTDAKPTRVMKQALADTERGIKDTSKEPEMLVAYEKQKK